MSSKFIAPGTWQAVASILPPLILAAAIAGTHMSLATASKLEKSRLDATPALAAVAITQLPLQLSALTASAFGDWEIDG